MMNSTTAITAVEPDAPKKGPEVVAPPDAKRKPAGREFIASLESARGLAALSVALFHSFHLLPVDGARVYDRTLWDASTTSALLMRMIMIPFNGGAAVSLFFVLSGYVLTLSFRRDERRFAPKALSFSGRRILRIYPALAVNLVLMAAVLAGMAMLLPKYSPPKPSLAALGTNLLLFDFPINGATWTLLVEMLVIPFLLIAFVLRRGFGFWGTIAFVVAGFAALIKPKLLGFVTLNLPQLSHNMLIAQFLFMFSLGVLVAEIGSRGLPFLTRRMAAISLVAALLAMLNARFLLGYGARGALITEAVGAMVIVAVLAHGPRMAVHRVFETGPLRFLGRTSYSFYLYHPLALGAGMTILTALATSQAMEAHPFVWSAIIAVTTISVTIPLSWASFTWVEKPMVKLGRKF